ncbi:MAG: helix-hairpin-helix domain-containing protein [Pseudomonadota bacterium]
MKNPDRKTVSQLEMLPNIGKVMAADLRLVGIIKPQDLIAQNPFYLYEKLCKITHISYDPCVLDVFMSAVNFMEGGAPLPWWSFTQERKKKMGKK